MTHLKIEQNNIPENVTRAVIKSLYDNVKNMDLSNVQLSGNLQVPAASEKAVNYLNGEVSEGIKRFPNLNVTAQKLYIDFEDPIVEALLVSLNTDATKHYSSGHVGDGIGITIEQAADIKMLSGTGVSADPFYNNSQIETFNELPYFTRLQTNSSSMNRNMFSGSSIREVDLRGITYVFPGMFYNCSNLQSIGNTDSVQYVNDTAFSKCSNLKIDINMPSLVNIYSKAFYYSGITSISNLGSITTIKNTQNDGVFSECHDLKKIDLHTTTQLETIERCGFKNCFACETIHFPSSISTIADYAFENATSLRWIKIDAETAPTITNATFNKANSSFKIYVPDSVVDDYKSSTWSNFSSRIFPISQFVTDFPNG